MPSSRINPEDYDGFDDGGPRKPGSADEGSIPVDEEGLPEIAVDVVHIQVGDWMADVLPISHMPAPMVLEVMQAEGPMQIVVTANLFKLAIMNPADAESLMALSFADLTRALNQWADKSNAKL